MRISLNYSLAKLFRADKTANAVKAKAKTAKAVAALLTLIPLASCSLMSEDSQDCPTGLYVRFVYDYNTQRADMFKDHVGYVEVLVFDEHKKLVASRSVTNSPDDSPLANYGYAVHFSPAEVPGGSNYRIQVIGMQKNYDDALNTDGAKYRYEGDHKEHAEALTMTLDHTLNTSDGYNRYAVSDTAPLDTLWHTLKVTSVGPIDGKAMPALPATRKPFAIYGDDGLKETGGEYNVKVENNRATYATVSLIRNTKHLSIGIHQVDPQYKKDMSGDRFEVRVIDRNATVTHDNEVIKDHTLCYSPYAAWTMMMDADGNTGIETLHKGNVSYTGQNNTKADEVQPDNVVERIPYYNIMFNRMMINNEDNNDNASLEITDKQSGDVVAKINLPHYLSLGRDAYALQNYSQQEYLDREYNYNLDFFLSGSQWVAMDIRVLSWTKRIQVVDL